eukprot:TRINITY_DN3136_c0_g1_i1.p1 TRINITY_DN3136_c0_g1~~TRINITY_DN3136_c0_g1_i1.p1  ORF type:complete len:201 (-),score=47.01 TRINITY_DN3136_c0_g1_i1:106-708(-)
MDRYYDDFLDLLKEEFHEFRVWACKFNSGSQECMSVLNLVNFDTCLDLSVIRGNEIFTCRIDRVTLMDHKKEIGIEMDVKNFLPLFLEGLSKPTIEEDGEDFKLRLGYLEDGLTFIGHFEMVRESTSLPSIATGLFLKLGVAVSGLSKEMRGRIKESKAEIKNNIANAAAVKKSRKRSAPGGSFANMSRRRKKKKGISFD